MRVVAATCVAPVVALLPESLRKCAPYWNDVFKDIDSESPLAFMAIEAKTDGGVYQSDVDACATCVQGVVNSQDCDFYMNAKCFAVNHAVSLGATYEEGTEMVGGEKVIKNKKIDSKKGDTWTYYKLYSAPGSNPEEQNTALTGAVDCKHVLRKSWNPTEPESKRKEGCSVPNQPHCGSEDKIFRDCCADHIPEAKFFFGLIDQAPTSAEMPRAMLSEDYDSSETDAARGQMNAAQDEIDTQRDAEDAGI